MTPPTPNDMPGAAQQPDASSEQAPQQPTPATPATETPPWGSDTEFNPEKAWGLIQNLRKDLEKFDPEAKGHIQSLKTENESLRSKLSVAQPILDEHERLRRASQTELDTAREDLSASQGRESTWRNIAVTETAKALTADKFVDADTVLALVGDLSGYVDGDTIDTPKLQQRLDQLAADKPFLVKQQPPQGFTPNRGQGQSGTGQLPIDAQIKAAQERGDIRASIALKQQQYYSQQKK